MELKDTIALMTSGNHKDRFKAEYWQTKIRYDKLHKMCVQYAAGTLEFEPDTALEVLDAQASSMGNYLKCLELRAEIEEIDLNV